jgi:predicted esterase
VKRLLLLLLLAAPRAAEEYERGKIVERLACAGDPTQTYAYYLPIAYTPDRRWPIVYVFDPRQRGAFAAELFHDAAEEYGWIVVSSNDTRSDGPWEPNEKALRAMWPDAQRRFAVDPKRIYASGFSGGAMLAWSLARSTRAVAGVIGCSGRLESPGDADGVAFDWFGTAGEADFNYLETRAIDGRLTGNHRFESFAGGHRWAPRELLRQAMGWMELQAMRRGTRPRDEALIAKLLREELAVTGGDELAVSRRREAIARTFAGLADVPKSAVDAKTVARLQKEERRAFDFERGHRARMPGAMTDFLAPRHRQPPTTLLASLQVPALKRLAAEPTYRGAAARRVLAVIKVQLVFYLPQDLRGRGEARLAADLEALAQEIQ